MTLTVSATAVSPAVPGDFALSANQVLTITAGQTSSTGNGDDHGGGQRHRRPRQGVDGIGRGDVGADGTGGTGVAGR